MRGRLQRGDAVLACHALTASLAATGCGSQPQQMADGIDEVGAVQRVEMELADALIDEVHHLLGRHRGGDEVRGLRIGLEPVEAPRQPRRHGRAAAAGKARHLLEIVDRHDARHDRRPDAVRARRLEEAQEVGVVEEELGDDAGRPGIDLGFEVVEVGGERRAVGVLFRIARHRHLQPRDLLEAGHQVGGIGVAAGMRGCTWCRRPSADRRASATMWRTPAAS